LCNLVVVLLESQFGSGVPRTRQGSLVGCIHHRDENKVVIAAKKIEAGRECPQRLIGSIGAQQDWGCHGPTVAIQVHDSRRRTIYWKPIKRSVSGTKVGH
jgi:hypothetical protein